MKIVFLDRDGVINRFPGHGSYVTKIKDFHFLPGSLQALRSLTENGYKIFIISNQAGVGRGIFSADKLKCIDAYMHRHVKRTGGKITRSFYCTHRSDEGCSCRKPEIGLIQKAWHFLKASKERSSSFFVGDMQKDIQTGHKAGVQTIFVRSGGEKPSHSIDTWTVKPDFIVKDLKAAVEVIQHEDSSHSRNSRRRT